MEGLRLVGVFIEIDVLHLKVLLYGDGRVCKCQIGGRRRERSTSFPFFSLLLLLLMMMVLLLQG